MTQGRLIVLSAPSGSGKTTIARAVMNRYPAMLFSVSATTRSRRPNETDGKDYFFLSKDEFQSRIALHGLVEWEEIYGNYYGTLKSEVDKVLTAGSVMMFDVDVKGALSIKRAYPEDAVLIFIRPPSVETLRQRLVDRKTEDAATVETRMQRVAMELEMVSQFDHVVVNDQLDRAIEEVDAIVRQATEHVIQLSSSFNGGTSWQSSRSV